MKDIMWNYIAGAWVATAGGCQVSILGRLTGGMREYVVRRDGQIVSITRTLEQAKEYVKKRTESGLTLKLGEAVATIEFL